MVFDEHKDSTFLKLALFKRVPLTTEHRKKIIASGRIVTSGLTRNFFCETFEIDSSSNTDETLARKIFDVWGEGVYYALKWKRRIRKSSNSNEWGEHPLNGKEYPVLSPGKLFEIKIKEDYEGSMEYFFIDKKRISKYKFWKGSSLNKKKGFF